MAIKFNDEYATSLNFNNREVKIVKFNGANAWAKPYILTINTSGKTNITVMRTASNEPTAAVPASLRNGDIVYYGDILEVTVSAARGWKSPTSFIDGLDGNNKVTGNVTITGDATRITWNAYITIKSLSYYKFDNGITGIIPRSPFYRVQEDGYRVVKEQTIEFAASSSQNTYYEANLDFSTELYFRLNAELFGRRVYISPEWVYLYQSDNNQYISCPDQGGTVYLTLVVKEKSAGYWFEKDTAFGSRTSPVSVTVSGTNRLLEARSYVRPPYTNPYTFAWNGSGWETSIGYGKITFSWSQPYIGMRLRVPGGLAVQID